MLSEMTIYENFRILDGHVVSGYHKIKESIQVFRHVNAGWPEHLKDRSLAVVPCSNENPFQVV